MRPFSYITVELTRRCNLNCKHCIIDKKNTRDLPLKDLFNFIDKNHDQFGDITITGGEPTLRRDLPEIIKGIHKYNKRVAIITNGTNIERLLNADLVKISLDFPNPQHDLWRGRDGLSYNIIHKVIPELQRNRIPLEILYTVTKENFFEIRQMVHLARELDARLIFQRYIPKSKDDELNLTLKQLQWLFDFIRKNRQKENISYYGGLGHFISGKPNFCGAGLTKVHIDVKGRITPCMFLLDNSYGMINNSFKKVRKNILTFRKEYEKEVIQSCGNCKNYPEMCAGDCIAIAKVFKNEKGMCWEVKCQK